MKTWKQSTFIGIMAILVLAFALVACDGKGNNNGNGNGNSNPFKGRWENAEGQWLVFTDSTYTGHSKSGDVSGTYTWTGNGDLYVAEGTITTSFGSAPITIVQGVLNVHDFDPLTKK